jgi:hypothetical protein
MVHAVIIVLLIVVLYNVLLIKKAVVKEGFGPDNKLGAYEKDSMGISHHISGTFSRMADQVGQCLGNSHY